MQPVSLNEKMYVVFENFAYFLEDKFGLLLSGQKKLYNDPKQTKTNAANRMSLQIRKAYSVQKHCPNTKMLFHHTDGGGGPTSLATK